MTHTLPDQTITTGHGWIALDGSCLQVSHAAHAMCELRQHAPWLRVLYNTVIDRDSSTYYRFLNQVYERGYIQVSKQARELLVESCGVHYTMQRQPLIQQIQQQSQCDHVTHLSIPASDNPFSLSDRRQWFTENLCPPGEKS